MVCYLHRKAKESYWVKLEDLGQFGLNRASRGSVPGLVTDSESVSEGQKKIEISCFGVFHVLYKALEASPGA